MTMTAPADGRLDHNLAHWFEYTESVEDAIYPWGDDTEVFELKGLLLICECGWHYRVSNCFLADWELALSHFTAHRKVATS